MANKDYTTEALVEAYLGESFDGTTVPTSTQVAVYVGYAEKEIDERTGTTFTAQTNTDEINSSDGTGIIRLLNRPIIAMTNFYVDEAGLGSDSSPDWVARSEGRTGDEDYVVYKSEGHLDFYRDKPPYGINNTKCTYTSGYATVPKHVEHLATLLVSRMIVKGKIADNAYNSQSHIQVGPIRIGQAGSQVASSVSEIDKEIDNMWSSVGILKSHML